MTGFSDKADEHVAQGGRFITSVTNFMKNLDAQLLVMERTDQDLIERLKQQEKAKAEIERRHEMNRIYHEKLSLIKKEEKRHLRAAKRVPKAFDHQYEMDKRSTEFVR